MKLYYCGFNAFGQHPTKEFSSNSTTSNIFKFQEYPIKRIINVAFSWSYVIVLSEDGLYVSGYIDGKQNQLKKVKVPGEQETVQQVSASEHRALLTTVSGECWQYKPAGDSWKKLHKFITVETETNAKTGEHQTKADHIVKVYCGEKINAALSANGVAYAIPSPLYVPEVRVTDVVCGFEHGLLLTENGRIYSWGGGSRGQLGHGELESEEIPREVNALAGMRIINIAAGGWHSAAITEWGDLYTWGWNNSRQLGFHSPETASKNKVSAVSVAEMKEQPHNLADKRQLLSSCTAGKNEQSHSSGITPSSLPNNENICSSENYSSNTEIPTSKRQKVDTASCKHEVAILSIPTAIDWPGGIDIQVREVSCGARHTVALLSDDTVWGCGWSAYGQLGDSLQLTESSGEMRQMHAPNTKICKIYCGSWSTGILTEDND